jgi:hypothetical protein
MAEAWVAEWDAAGLWETAGKPVYHRCADDRCHDLIDVSTVEEGYGTTFIPGPCRHSRAVPVEAVTGEVLAWLCLCCDRQLQYQPRT